MRERILKLDSVLKKGKALVDEAGYSFWGFVFQSGGVEQEITVQSCENFGTIGNLRGHL